MERLEDFLTNTNHESIGSSDSITTPIILETTLEMTLFSRMTEIQGLECFCQNGKSWIHCTFKHLITKNDDIVIDDLIYMIQ